MAYISRNYILGQIGHKDGQIGRQIGQTTPRKYLVYSCFAHNYLVYLLFNK